MRRISRNVYAEIYFWGCNPGFVETSDGVVMVDSPQQPIDAVRWREMLQEKGPIRHLINTEPHADHILGNAYFPDVEVIGQVKLQDLIDAAECPAVRVAEDRHAFGFVRWRCSQTR